MGVIVDNTLAAAEAVNSDREKRVMQERLETLDKVHAFVQELNQSRDPNDTRGVSIRELCEMWQRPEMVTILKLIRLPVGATPDELLAPMDTDGNGKIDPDEFVMNTVRLLTSDKGEIQLRVELMELAWIRLSVSDTGRGIKPEERDFTFEPFRLQNT